MVHAFCHIRKSMGYATLIMSANESRTIHFDFLFLYSCYWGDGKSLVTMTLELHSTNSKRMHLKATLWENQPDWYNLSHEGQCPPTIFLKIEKGQITL